MKKNVFVAFFLLVIFIAPSFVSAQEVTPDLIRQEQIEAGIAKQVIQPVPGTTPTIQLITPANPTVKRVPGRVVPITWKKNSGLATVTIDILPNIPVGAEAPYGYPFTLFKTNLNKINWKIPNIHSGIYTVRASALGGATQDAKQITVYSGAPNISSAKITKNTNNGLVEVVALNNQNLNTARAPYSLVIEQHKDVSGVCTDASYKIPLVLTAKSLVLKSQLPAAQLNVINPQCRNSAWVENKAMQKSNIIPLSIISSVATSTGTSTATSTATSTPQNPNDSLIFLSMAPTPTSQKYLIDEVDGVQGARMLDFTIAAGTGNYRITSVKSLAIASPTAPTTLYLYDGSTLVASKAVQSKFETVVFDNLSIVFAKNQIKTLSIRADFPTNTVSGTAVTVQLEGVGYVNGAGLSSNLSGPIVGAWHTISKAQAVINLSGQPTITKTSNQNGSTVSMTATFPFNVTSLGGTTAKPTAATFTIVASTNTVNNLPTVTATPVVIPNNDIINGSIAQVTAIATLSNASVVHSGQYIFKVTKIRWVTNGVATDQTTGLESFVTPTSLLFQK